MAVFLIVDTFAIAARLYVRIKMLTRGFGLDDVVLILTYLGFIISCAMGFTSMHYGYAAQDEQPYYDKAMSTKASVVSLISHPESDSSIDPSMTSSKANRVTASSATIVKLVIIVRLSTAKGEEAQALHYDLLLWADIELGMATFAASAAALRPLLKHIPAFWTKNQSSNSRSRSTSEAVGPYRELGASNELHPVSKNDARGANRKDPDEEIFVV
ncbi:hypothetical protein Daesc_001692 [Daldinia eschscholtzii]|uniref:Integral membrane protein n=1 Tax=Daldinia eschscholtzii TaxID=292717 RepID=A0AAX6MUW8_9PEZI